MPENHKSTLLRIIAGLVGELLSAAMNQTVLPVRPPENEALSRQWMPDQREANGHRGQERADSRKRYADFHGFVPGN